MPPKQCPNQRRTGSLISLALDKGMLVSAFLHVIICFLIDIRRCMSSLLKNICGCFCECTQVVERGECKSIFIPIP